MSLRIFYILILSFGFFNVSHSQLASMVGDAENLGGDCFNITPNQLNQTGAVWYTEPFDLTQYFSFTVDLNLGNSDAGADGVVLVLQQAGLDAIGITGGGLGYEGITPSLGVEFDSWNNLDLNDIAQDHMAININGNVQHNSPNNLSGPVSILSNNTNAENGQFIQVRLVWNPIDQEVKIFTNCVLRLSASIDLINDVFAGNPMVTWGFTGSTGGATNQQQVCFVEASYLNPDVIIQHCEAEDLLLSIDSPNPENITWSPNLYINNINSSAPVVSPTEDITYTVNYTECGEEFTDVFQIEVTSLELNPIENVTVCPSESFEFTASYNSLLDLTWSSGSMNNLTENYSTAGSHWVEVTDGNCTKRENFELLNADLPVITYPAQVEYCFLDSTLVEVTSPMTSITLPDGSLGNDFYVSEEGIYNVTATSSETGCENSAQIEVIELPLPTFNLDTEYEICPYETLELSVDAGYTTSWNDGQNGFEASFNEPNNYTVTSELNGCEQSFDFELIVNLLPVSNLSGSFEFCEDDGLVLTNGYSNHSVTWHNGITSDSFTFDESGTHLIQISDLETGCFTTEEITVIELFNPIIEIDDEYLLCEGDRITIDPVLKHVNELIWSNGFEGDEYEFITEEEFTITAINECSSVNKSSIISLILCDCKPFIPLAFTPDNDGINEVFSPKLTCDPIEYSIEIFNRWGEIVFSSLDFKEPWRGNHQRAGYYVPAGVYSYKLSYTSAQYDGIRTEVRTGTVSVIR